MKIREYRGPLTVLASGVVGFSLFCIVAAAALTDPRAPNAAAMQPQDLVDSAISNINTMAALTVESVSQFIPTATLSPSVIYIGTELPTNSPTIQPTPTRIPPTSTRNQTGSLPTSTPTPLPTRTSTPVPSDTPQPTFTYSPEPTFTDTPEPPPTDTPEPPPTDTDTPEPPPTDTLEPAGTAPLGGSVESTP